MKIFKLIHPLLISAMLLAGCSSSDEPDFSNNPRKSIDLSRSEQTCCEQMNDFNVEILKAASAITGNNAVLSPLSVSMYLSMRANYATDESAERIYKTLGTKDLSTLNSLNRKIMSELKQLDKATIIDLANGLWYDNAHTPKDGLTTTLKDSYKADIFACAPAKGPKLVHDWVSKESHGLIDFTPEVFTTLTANVLYFKSLWKDKFSEYRTKEADFYGKKGSSKVKMMYNDEVELFAEGDNFEACKKPFGNGAFNCVFVLPDEGVDIDDFTRNITASELASLKFNEHPSSLYVPRFELRSKLDNMEPVLAQMGLANLRGTAIQHTEESEEVVYHETYLKVDEDGAEVAAITSGMDTLAPSPSGVWEFKLNRPFLIFIHEASTGACILAGKVVNL